MKSLWVMAVALGATLSLPAAPKAEYRVLGAISSSHMVNDMMQSLILAMYPILKGDFHLSFVQIGFITLTYQLTASLLQPLIGLYTDRRPLPYSLPCGMVSTLIGLLLLAFAPSYAVLLLAAAFVGMGSAVFHPESSRIARLASGGKHGLAQSVFQVGGNTGSAIGPLLAAAVIDASDQQIHLLPGGRQPLDGGAGGDLVLHVEHQRQELFTQLVGQGGQPFGAATGAYHPVTSLHQQTADGLTKPGRGARYHCDHLNLHCDLSC